MVKKRIVHIAFKHSSDDNRIFQKECVSLAKRQNYDVTYVTSDIKSKEDSCDKKGVHIIILHSYPKRIIRQFVYLFQIRKFIKNFGKIDVVHLHEMTLLPLALWMKRRKIKVIYDSHEDYYKQLQMNGRKFFAKIYKLYEKRVCKKIDAVIFPCKMTGEGPFDYGVKNLTFIDNYPIVEKKQLEVKKNENFIACYVGMISSERGVINDIKAWYRAGVKGILAGDFSDKNTKTSVLGMKEFANVDYKGYCSVDEVKNIYNESSVGMATLRNYGQYYQLLNLPTKVCEYMSYGMPTIISRTPYVEEVMKRYRFGIMVDPDNIDEIVDALCSMRDNPDIVEEMGQAGRRAVEEVFNWDVEEKKLYKLYDILLGKE